MKYLSILLFPSLLWAEKPAKAELPPWFCDGYVKGYDENIAVIEDRWQTVKTFKLEGPTGGNVASTEVTFDKHKANVSFTFNSYGTMSMFDEPMKSEGVSFNVSVGEKHFAGDSFQVMDGARLPVTIGLRTDFELDKKAYVVRLVCKRNKK